MGKQTTILLLIFLLIPVVSNAQVIQEQKLMDANRIRTPFINTGIFNRDITINNHPGFEWPKGNPQGACLIFTTGLTIAAKVNGQIRMAAASYSGEYAPGYILNGVAMTDSRFHLYKIYRTDNANNNPDYANWGLMVPYGAPYEDINLNGIYDPGIDKPGVTGASETIFICMTDGFPENHNQSEGFAGGTTPLMAEAHLTAWCYNLSGLDNANFMKWEIINKSGTTWNGAIFSMVADLDVGDATDDWIGCDTALDMGYAYNGDNNDGGGGPGTYGTNPPAVGISFLKTPDNKGLTSFSAFTPGQHPLCWRTPDNPTHALNFMKGLQKFGTPHVNAVTLNTTKFLFEGNPETGEGWTENDGRVDNCSGDTTGSIVLSSPGDRGIVMSTGDSLYTVNNNQTITIVASQQADRGNNHLHSVTKLRVQTTAIRNYWQTIGITPISSEIPESFRLHQNYPNPFNPNTKIRFEIPNSKATVKLTVYDIAGKEVVNLVNVELNSGIYEYDFNGENLSSGMYFYRLETDSFIETKKMVLVK